MTKSTKVVAKVLLASCLLFMISIQICSGSAIPIWEFLMRNEKMSYLYSSFANLVSVHCKATATTTTLPVNHCKRDLLNYGYEKLQTLSDVQLEALDPYQHGANELIWNTIMRERTNTTQMITTHKPASAELATSVIVLAEEKEFTRTSNDNKNVDLAYAATTAVTSEPKPFLSGPLIIRVRPDGRPVEEDRNKPLPRDDDFDLFRQTDIRSSSGSRTEGALLNKHRKIATINALKEQQFTGGVLQRELQPPLVERTRQYR